MNRIKAFLIDYVVILLVSVAVDFLLGQGFALWSTIFLLLIRDCLGGSGLGKRLLGLSVTDMGNEKSFSIRLVLRNLTLFILPIEGVILALGKKNRLGDLIFKTSVESRKVATWATSQMLVQILIALLLSFLITHLVIPWKF